MKRHSGASGKLAKSRPKSSKSKSRNPAKVAGTRPSRSGAEAEVTQLRRELNDALEQQTATSEVLQIISSSPGDLQRVFESLLANATQLCGAAFGNLLLWEGGRRYRVVAQHNPPGAYAELRRREPIAEIGLETPLARAAAIKTFIQVADFTETVGYKRREPSSIALGDLGGARTFLVVPMLKENEVIGAIAIYRQEVRPFTDKQIALVTNFAAQAVIAIENARLLNELRQSLEQQTATAEVLQVVGSSLGDLESVFAAMLENAVRICDAKFGNIYGRDGDVFRLLATHNTPPRLAEHRRRSPVRSDPTTLFRSHDGGQGRRSCCRSCGRAGLH